MRIRFIQWAITIIAVIVVLLHVYLPDLKIDGVTVTLLGIACLPWLAPIFRAVELPGGLKIEFQDLQAAKKKAEDTGLVPAEDEKPKEKGKRHVYAFEAVAGSDLNLALAGLRIEIESRLRDLAKARGIAEERKSIGQLTKELVKCEALSNQEASAIADVLPLLNRAAHGAVVDERASEWALEFGPRLLDALEDRLGETSIPELIAQWRQRDGAAVSEIGTLLSKALVSSPRAFLIAMKGDPESFRPWLDGLGQHTFTIYESRSEVDDDLYMAHYQKLKQLMQDAVARFQGTELDNEASRIITMLKNVEIKRIW